MFGSDTGSISMLSWKSLTLMSLGPPLTSKGYTGGKTVLNILASNLNSFSEHSVIFYESLT